MPNQTQPPIDIDLDALQAELEWCIAEGHSGPRTHACLKSLQPIIARLRKAEADANRYRKACSTDDNAETLYAAVLNNAGDQAAINAEFDAAPDSADSEGAKG